MSSKQTCCVLTSDAWRWPNDSHVVTTLMIHVVVVVELVWLDPVEEGVQMTHLLSSSDVIYTLVINRDGRSGLAHPGCLLLQILLPCRIMTPARTRLCQSVLVCVPSGWWELCSWIIWKTISSWQQISFPFCVIWVMEMFSRNENMFTDSEQVFWLEVHQWHQTASLRMHLISGWSILSTPGAFHYLCTLDYLLHSH